MNEEFQELKGRLNMPGVNHEEVVEQLRNNLLARNYNNAEYTLGYTDRGRTYNINTCTEEELLKIDGDMSPIGL